MDIKKLFLFIASLIIFIQASQKNALANEGTVSMKNEELNTACVATSVYVSNQFKILIRCSNLIYPPPPGGYYYSVWSSDEDGGQSRLGDLEYGRNDFNQRKAFSGLFVTSENTVNPSKPSDKIVLKGDVVPFEFDKVEVQQEVITPANQVNKEDKVEQTESPSSAISGFLKFLKNLGVITGGVILVGALVFFVISRIRRGQ